jgi:hypothetical protein
MAEPNDQGSAAVGFYLTYGTSGRNGYEELIFVEEQVIGSVYCLFGGMADRRSRADVMWRGYLTKGGVSRINREAAVAATRGDLGQLAPRKKLLKSCRVSQKNF